MEENIKAAYARLEWLYEAIPRMEEKNRRLLWAEGAEKLLAIEKRIASLRAECTAYEEECRAAAAQGKLGNERVAAELLSLRAGPLAQAEQARGKILAESGFESAEQAREFLMSAQERESLGAEIEAFKADYQAALAACQALESLLGEE